MAGIVDYGMGNLRSVAKACELVGLDAEVITLPEQVLKAQGLILPGVGAFPKAMANLAESGLDDAIRAYLDLGRPFLGICLGLQLLFEMSEETFAGGMRNTPGLGVLPGCVRRFPPGEKVPQIGWNQLKIIKENPLFTGVADGAYVYFVHSYYVDPDEDGLIAATTDYGIRFTSAVSSGHIHAIQFHPEKSSQVGLQILRNFRKLVKG